MIDKQFIVELIPSLGMQQVSSLLLFQPGHKGRVALLLRCSESDGTRDGIEEDFAVHAAEADHMGIAGGHRRRADYRHGAAVRCNGGRGFPRVGARVIDHAVFMHTGCLRSCGLVISAQHEEERTRRAILHHAGRLNAAAAGHGRQRLPPGAAGVLQPPSGRTAFSRHLAAGHVDIALGIVACRTLLHACRQFGQILYFQLVLSVRLQQKNGRQGLPAVRSADTYHAVVHRHAHTVGTGDGQFAHLSPAAVILQQEGGVVEDFAPALGCRRLGEVAPAGHQHLAVHHARKGSRQPLRLLRADGGVRRGLRRQRQWRQGADRHVVVLIVTPGGLFLRLHRTDEQQREHQEKLFHDRFGSTRH